MAEARGINGRNGFIPYPGIVECGEDFDTWAARILREQSGGIVAPDNHHANIRMAQEQAAHEAKEIRSAQAHGGPTPRLGYGFAEQRRAPGKMFSRVEILAILRAERGRYMGGLRIAPVHDCPSEAAVVNSILNIFENLE